MQADNTIGLRTHRKQIHLAKTVLDAANSEAHDGFSILAAAVNKIDANRTIITNHATISAVDGLFSLAVFYLAKNLA
jgi:hypothetical protein